MSKRIELILFWERVLSGSFSDTDMVPFLGLLCFDCHMASGSQGDGRRRCAGVCQVRPWPVCCEIFFDMSIHILEVTQVLAHAICLSLCFICFIKQRNFRVFSHSIDLGADRSRFRSQLLGLVQEPMASAYTSQGQEP